MDRKINEDKKICLGKIVSVHGIKGLVKIKSFTENPTDIDSYGNLSDASNNVVPLKINGAHKDLLIASIDGIDNRTDAEKFIKTKLYVSRNAMPETQEDDFYIEDLIGMKAQNSNGDIIGEIINIHNFGAGDIVEVKFTEEKEGKCFLFTKKTFPHIDIKAKTIKIILF